MAPTPLSSIGFWEMPACGNREPRGRALPPSGSAASPTSRVSSEESHDHSPGPPRPRTRRHDRSARGTQRHQPRDGAPVTNEAWRAFGADADLRVAILTGAGDKAFCAGGGSQGDRRLVLLDDPSGAPQAGRGRAGIRRHHPQPRPRQTDRGRDQRRLPRRWFRDRPGMRHPESPSRTLPSAFPKSGGD